MSTVPAFPFSLEGPVEAGNEEEEQEEGAHLSEPYGFHMQAEFHVEGAHLSEPYGFHMQAEFHVCIICYNTM